MKEGVDYKSLVVDYFASHEVNKKDGNILTAPLLIERDTRTEVIILIHGEVICRQNSVGGGGLENGLLWYRIYQHIMSNGVKRIVEKSAEIVK